MRVDQKTGVNQQQKFIFFYYFSLDLFVILPHRLDIYTQRDGRAADRKKDK
jgi:hypothetical protein